MLRIKIALLSVVLSGSVLVGLGLYSLSVMNDVGLARIDREILALGEGHLAVRPPRGYWQDFATSLKFIYGEERSGMLIVQIKAPDNEVLFRSGNWPAEISEASFPGFDRTMDSRPPRSEGREAGRLRPPDRSGEQPPRRPGERKAEERRRPPPEAYAVCAGKPPGTPAQFVNPRGETVQGICEDEDGTMVLRRTRPRGDDGGPDGDRAGQQRVSGPEGQNPPEWSMPRIKKKPSLATIATSSGLWRTGIMGTDRITLMIGVNMADYLADAARYRRAFLGIVPIVLLLLAGGGWLLARRALRPVSLITRTAEQITARALNQRVPRVDSDGELSRLVEVINGMLDRLEKSFGQAIRFSADAAHELQTPLTILQGALDEAVQHAPDGSGEQQRYGELLEEVRQLKAVVQKLLILARADAGRLNLRLEAVNVSAIVEAAAEDAAAMAPALRIEKAVAPGIVVPADRDLLAQAIRNLTSNAVKYNRPGGRIRFQLAVRGKSAYVTVSNSGVPIPAQDRERVFDRFYRVDQSRGKTVAGSGLGLSLAREIARAHRGELRLNPDSGDMISFTLSLPCNTG